MLRKQSQVWHLYFHSTSYLKKKIKSALWTSVFFHKCLYLNIKWTGGQPNIWYFIFTWPVTLILIIHYLNPSQFFIPTGYHSLFLIWSFLWPFFQSSSTTFSSTTHIFLSTCYTFVFGFDSHSLNCPWKSYSMCYRLNICASPNSYVQVLTFSMAVFGNGSLRK